MTTYAGIDYGSGVTNINTTTGIRFGVISQNAVSQAWCDSSEPVYSYHCPECGTYLEEGADTETCPSCKKAIREQDFDFQESDCFIYNKEGYKCQSDSSNDIFITESPYFTYAQFCSPCAPGACYLENPLDEPNKNNKCYCFGPDWFDDEKAPYPVYSVETGKRV
jgi:hypothetical protein